MLVQGGKGKEQPGNRRRRPFPPKHYIATVESLKNFEYPLPTEGPSGELHCPEGFIATRSGLTPLLATGVKSHA